MAENTERKAGEGQFLNRSSAARYLRDVHGMRCEAQTLASWAVSGKGPSFLRNGRFPIYALASLDAFAASRTSGPYRSTSDVAQ